MNRLLTMNRLLKIAVITLTTLVSLHTVASNHAGHQAARQYSVTITNITKGISFTPFLAATHNRNIKFFTLGEAASEEISRIAEGGDISGLQLLLNSSNDVFATSSSAGLLNPGESVELIIESDNRNRLVSIAAMLLPTNDTLVALNGAKLPHRGKVSYLLVAYDGGTETNDELCISIPGPLCGGEPFSPEDAGEGYIYPSPAIHGLGDLSTQEFQWNGAVAKVEIEAL
jgi:hypothetical protein